MYKLRIFQFYNQLYDSLSLSVILSFNCIANPVLLQYHGQLNYDSHTWGGGKFNANCTITIHKDKRLTV